MMFKFISRILLGGLALVFLPACTPDDEPEAEPGFEAPASPAPEIPPTPEVTSAAALTVTESRTHGEHLADQVGRALYLLEADSAGSSTCYEECAREWPPFIAPEGTPTAGEQQVRSALIETTQRNDGALQVTYGGHPLYYYRRDEAPGEARGQDVHDQWGEWYLVTVEGEPLE